MFVQRAYQSFINWSPDTIIVYKSDVCNIGKRCDNGENLNFDRAKAYNGVISSKSINRYKKILTAWMNVLQVGNLEKRVKQKRIVMITLTLSSKQDFNGTETDKMIKRKMLEPMLKYLQYNFNIVNWFWRAEPQANGNIHFHILTDKYIPKLKIQDHWNKIQKRVGMLRDYEAKFEKCNPPSTHVQIYDLTEKNIAYILKYLTKKNDRRKIEGLQFRASNKLCHLKIMSQAIEKNEEISLLNEFDKKAKWKLYENFFIVYKFEFLVDEHFGLSKRFDLVDKYYLLCYHLMYSQELPSYFIHLANLYFTDRWKLKFLVEEFKRREIDIEPFFCALALVRLEENLF